jgi:hypothetical protein
LESKRLKFGLHSLRKKTYNKNIMIKEAAIRRDGKVFTGKRHSDIIYQMIRDGYIFDTSCVQGFITIDGNFLDRFQAYNHALECRQVSPKGSKMLFSEDLY